MENLAKQGNDQDAKPQKEQTEFILFSPEKAPEFFLVLDTKDKDILYLGKDKIKAERILKCVNGEWKIDMHEELLKTLKWALDTCKEIQSKKTSGLKYPETASLGSHIENLLKQAEQK